MKTLRTKRVILAPMFLLSLLAVGCDRVEVRPTRLTVNTAATDGDDGTGVTPPKRWVELPPFNAAAGQANAVDGATQVLWDWDSNRSVFNIDVDPGPSPESIADAEGTSEVEGVAIVKRPLFGRGDVDVSFRVDTKTRIALHSGVARVVVVLTLRPATGSPVSWQRTYDFNELRTDPTKVAVSVDGQQQEVIPDDSQHNGTFQRTRRLSPGRHFVSISMTVYSTADTRADLITEGSLHAGN
jgi:hypothetical protein